MVRGVLIRLALYLGIETWNILRILSFASCDVQISSSHVSPHGFNLTCQWTDIHAHAVLFFKKSIIQSTITGVVADNTFYSALQIPDFDRNCDIKCVPPLTADCKCLNKYCVQCTLNVRLDKQQVDQWKCVVQFEGNITSSNAINVTYGELLQITRFEVEIFDTVSTSLIENTTAEIRCVAEGWPVPRMRLIKGNHLVTDQYEYEAERENTIYIDYQLKPAHRYHSGKYICVVSNVHQELSNELHLNIVYPPTVLSLDNVYLKEGDTFTTSCKCQHGNPPETAIRWTKGDDAFSNETLLIKSVARTDAGIYTCTATNSDGRNYTGTDSKQFSLHVQYLPVVKKFQIDSFDGISNVTVKENDTVIFDCVGNGFPPPNLKLMNNNLQLNELFYESTQNTTTGIQHVITRARCSRLEKYTCTASNAIGFAGRDLYLSVMCPVRKDHKRTAADLNNIALRNLGEEVTFAFFGIANPLPNIFDYIWRKCTDISRSCSDIALSPRVTDTNLVRSNLTLENITESDYGMYMLQVGNGIGKTHTELYFLKRPGTSMVEDSSVTKAQNEHVNVTNNILAGASALVVLVITVAVACVCRFYRRSHGSHVTENVVPLNNPAIERRFKRNVQPPFNGVMSRIYDEIDPGIFVSESPVANEDALMALQGLTKVERYETLDRSELRDESKYNTIVSF